ncbi:MAG: Rpn family recombination-promoting nuclease/putative transposase, partial [Spirochaetia bacterium]|nr:Rpn family recombination-promoting nuclease/putative transposase [Spirochaetia bacterium]
MPGNREYKDGVFRMLFNNKDKLRQLYNAITGTHYTKKTPIKINTLVNPIFTTIRNDVSFAIGGKILCLIEHQSTVNENMPLRMLLYYALILLRQKTLDMKKTGYKRKKSKTPRPRLIVLYNGKRDQREKSYLHLSDLFEDVDEEENGLVPDQDFLITVLNINQGYNEDIKRKCPTLGEYSIFVATVRRKESQGMALEEAL